MSKELYVSSTPHETKVAVVEDDELTEIYFERENEYTLAGSIYKGRVTRVLPGMQSAFVDVGLERDAFLYVTDFLEEQEDQEEFEQVIARAHEDAIQHPSAPNAGALGAPLRNGGQPSAEAPPSPSAEPMQTVAEQPEMARPATSEPAHGPERDHNGEAGGRWRGRRRRRGRGRGFPESKFARQEPRTPEPANAPAPTYQPVILPGESISKYQHLASQTPAVGGVSAGAETATLAASQEPRGVSIVPEGHAEPRAAAQGNQEQVQLSENEEEERFDNMNVAGVFGGDEADTDAEGSAPRVADAGERDQQHASFAPGSGVIEEEEIEDEEAELATPEEDLELGEYEELEEETFDRTASGIADKLAAPELTEAIEEADTDRAAIEAEEEFDDEGEEEQESESVQEDAVAPSQGAEARAETRGAPGTAGFQQRTERQPFERRRRRRGGRRMHSRRNIQRGPAPKITDLLKEGQEILVQIAKEPIGKKGARITSHIALPGRFLVYMPTVNHIGVSRKIASDEERQRLKRLILAEHQGPGGFIVRTAAAGASDDDLRADVRFLLNLWSEIRNRAESSKAPALIYHDLNLVERTLRDQVTANFTHIWVDTEQEYERVLRFVSRFQPGLVKRVKLYTKETPLFEQFNIQEEVNKALKSKVWLKSGGYIVINQTEALVAIDVNTGKYVGKTARLEDTIVKTNVDAIKEIVRQIRLRDLGGIIVIDFIDMDERRNRQKVLQALEEELKHDRAPSKVLAFNDFGLVAITRKRVRQSLERTLGSPCPYCTGTGLVKSVPTVCNEIYIEMRKLAKHKDGSDILLRANPEVVKALKANGGRWLQEMEELTGRTVIVKSDPALHQEQFDLN
jgi:ribonuclease G